MKCLLVTYSFAPLNVISAQRMNSLAAFLASRGHSVDVLTAVKRPLDGPVNAFDDWSRLRGVVDIHEVGFLGRVAGDYGASAGGFDPGQKGRSSSSARRILKRIKRELSRFFGLLFDYRTIWAVAASRYYKSRLAKNEYDLVVTSSGPVAVNYIGYKVKRDRPQTKWIADFRDLWSLCHTSEVYAPTRVAERAIERILLGPADRITTISDFLACQMHRLHGARVDVVRNGYDETEMSAVEPNSAFWAANGLAEKINIVYAGSIYPGRRDPRPLIEAVKTYALTGRVALHFFGFDTEDVEKYVRDLDASEYCFVHSSLPRREILAIQKASDANLFLESGAEDARGVLTGKLFELAALQRPVLSLGPPLGFESITLLEKTGLLIHWESLNGDLRKVLVRMEATVPKLHAIHGLTRSEQFEKLGVPDTEAVGVETRGGPKQC